jgi:hypothetical protein
LVCTCGSLDEEAIEKPSELELSKSSELVAVEDASLPRLVRTVWPGFVARASTPATTRPAAARTASVRLTPSARRFAASIRDT